MGGDLAENGRNGVAKVKVEKCGFLQLRGQNFRLETVDPFAGRVQLVAAAFGGESGGFFFV